MRALDDDESLDPVNESCPRSTQRERSARRQTALCASELEQRGNEAQTRNGIDEQEDNDDVTSRTKIAEDIHLGRPVSDASFDRIYPAWIRRVSSGSGPVEVTLRAASLLAVSERLRVLDIGACVGKQCAIGSLMTGASCTETEQRESLVEIGRRAVKALSISNIRLDRSTLKSVDWTPVR